MFKCGAKPPLKASPKARQVVPAACAVDGRQRFAQAQGAGHAVGVVLLQLAAPRLVDPSEAMFGAQQGTHHARQGVTVASQGDGPHQRLSDLMLRASF